MRGAGRRVPAAAVSTGGPNASLNESKGAAWAVCSTKPRAKGPSSAGAHVGQLAELEPLVSPLSCERAYCKWRYRCLTSAGDWAPG